MTAPEMLDERFMACTGYSTEQLKEVASLPIYDQSKKDYPIKEFVKKLEAHKMDEYTEPLYNYMLIECKKHNHVQNRGEKNKSITSQNLVFQEQLVESLKELLSGGTLLVEINIPKQKPYKIKNNQAIKFFTKSAIRSIEEEIRSIGLNFHPLSRKETEMAINNHEDVEWIKNWMESMHYIDQNYMFFTMDKFDDYFAHLNISDQFGAKKVIRQNLIDDYAYDHGYFKPLDTAELDLILKKIKELKSKRGRKESTADLKYIAFTLWTIWRLDSYIEDANIQEMSKIKIENKDLPFVHDCLAFFELIVDYKRSTKTKANLEPTIRKMIKTFNDPKTIKDTYERVEILKYRQAIS